MLTFGYVLPLHQRRQQPGFADGDMSHAVENGESKYILRRLRSSGTSSPVPDLNTGAKRKQTALERAIR